MGKERGRDREMGVARQTDNTDRENSTWTLKYSRTVALGAFRPNRESLRCYKLM